MKKILEVAILLLLFAAGAAFAKPQTLSWNWPTTDCVGDLLDQTAWVSAEIIYDTEPMPMPSDTDGPCGTSGDPDGPITATSVPITSPDPASITLNLQPNIQYYARIRVCYYSAGNCSNWSNQAQFIVAPGKPGAPIWLN